MSPGGSAAIVVLAVVLGVVVSGVGSGTLTDVMTGGIVDGVVETGVVSGVVTRGVVDGVVTVSVVDVIMEPGWDGCRCQYIAPSHKIRRRRERIGYIPWADTSRVYPWTQPTSR